MLKHFKITLFLSLLITSISAYTIEEKEDSLLSGTEDSPLTEMEQKNKLSTLYNTLEETYTSSILLVQESGKKQDFKDAKKEISTIIKEINDIELCYQNSQPQQFVGHEQETSVWDHGSITISKLIMEYGSHKSLYIIPQNIASMSISIHSLLSIPKGSWNEMIALILAHNNIGVSKSGPYVKKLFLLKENYANVSLVTSNKNSLDILNQTDRIIFLYAPPLQNIKTCFYFLDRIKNPNATFISQVGSKITIIGLVADVQKLVSLCDQVWDTDEKRVAKIYVPTKISTSDSIKLLKTYYGGLTDYSSPLISMKGGNGLSAFALAEKSSIAIAGKDVLVEEAIAMLKKTESQVNNPSETILFWHTCSHCNPVELAEILTKVYTSLISCNIQSSSDSSKNIEGYSYSQNQNPHMSHSPFDRIDAPTQEPKKASKKEATLNNFFPYPTNNSLLMVVRKDTLPKIKNIIKKLDTPKKMVEIEVLLCERRISHSSKSGINILKLNDSAKNISAKSASFNSNSSGILEFIFSSKQNPIQNIPAIDLTYNFLLSEENISITASPSTTTLNQIPTTLSITDQISVNNGVDAASSDKKTSYAREDFGITITLTPTIHEKEIDCMNDSQYITLENDIHFDTITSNINERPSVHKRHIKNTVRIANGETIILGGLRHKNQEKGNHKIPFLGEIPGFGKIFGSNIASKKTSEMFIFIKPTIIETHEGKAKQRLQNTLKKRPGDSSLLQGKFLESKLNKERYLFEESFSLFLGS